MARHAKQKIGYAAVGVSLAIALVANAAMASDHEADQGPGLCFEASTSSIDERAWPDVLDAIGAAIDERADFFPDATVVSVPDVRGAWVPQRSDTVKIGVWSLEPGEARTPEELQEALAGLDCRVSDSPWEARLSHDLLFATAERILAAARVPDETGEAPIPADATTEITVDHFPDESRIRTLLRFNVPVAFFNPGGECWIDDVLASGSVDAPPTSVATDGQQTDPLVGSACDRFRAFMVDGGLGERALSLLPINATLSDGTDITFETTTVLVDSDAIIRAGVIDR